MTKPQADILFTLTSQPGWQMYLLWKQETLDKLHKDLEWQKGDELLKVQGRIIEIRSDLGLNKKALDVLIF